MGSRIEHCGDIDSAVEQGRYEIANVPSMVFSKDRDVARDREVKKAIRSMNYNRVHDEIAKIVKYTLCVIHDGNDCARYQRMLQMPHYEKITEDVIKEIIDRYYS